MPVSPAYTSVSFYTRSDVPYYAINDRAAGQRVIELDLMTTAQRAAMPEDQDVTRADRLIVASPTTTGLIVIRALARSRHGYYGAQRNWRRHNVAHNNRGVAGVAKAGGRRSRLMDEQRGGGGAGFHPVGAARTATASTCRSMRTTGRMTTVPDPDRRTIARAPGDRRPTGVKLMTVPMSVSLA